MWAQENLMYTVHKGSNRTTQASEQVLDAEPAPLPVAADAADGWSDCLRQALQQWSEETPLYEVLSLPMDATFEEVEQQASAARSTLNELMARALSPRQRQQLEAARGLVDRAVAVLGNAQARAEYDAASGNFAGVARCIAGGLTATGLSALRTRFLAMHPGAESAATIYGTTAASWRKQGHLELAFKGYEKALAVDPLNLSLQQAYWKLKKQAPQASTPAP